MVFCYIVMLLFYVMLKFMPFFWSNFKFQKWKSNLKIVNLFTLNFYWHNFWGIQLLKIRRQLHSYLKMKEKNEYEKNAGTPKPCSEAVWRTNFQKAFTFGFFSRAAKLYKGFHTKFIENADKQFTNLLLE